VTQTLDRLVTGTPGRGRTTGSFGTFKKLERPGDVFRDLGPNWFASVMGTGIVANAAAVLPLRTPGLRVFATVVWALAAAWLVVLTAAFAVHWARYPERARGHAANPVMAQFWGAPAMALLTVGAGTLVLGQGLLGPAAVGADWVLWLAGTALGLVTAVWIPYLMMTRHEIGAADAFGGWLMPVVPPMVSAATGALLIPHVGSGPGSQGRLTLLLAWLVLAAAITIRTALRNRPGGLPFALTWWSFTFPVGTCVTGTIALAARSHADVLRGASVVLFGLLVLAWAVVAARTVSGAASGRLFAPLPASSRALST
jgi:tellurite resistance protein TehA-like permease